MVCERWMCEDGCVRDGCEVGVWWIVTGGCVRVDA